METNGRTEIENDNERVVKIELEHHSKLFDFFDNDKTFKRGFYFVSAILGIFLVGIIILVVTLKSFFPYYSIETNNYGATIIKQEDKEVIYWLLNSADVWANSGILVEKGEELTIKASGASHTALHRLVDEAKSNKPSSFDWVDADGRYVSSPGDPLLGKFRLANGEKESKLLMHIFPSDVQNNSIEWINHVPEKDLAKGTTFAIGHERTLVASESGILHFAVNDILLTDSVIQGIYKDYVDFLCKNVYEYDKKKLQDLQESVRTAIINNDSFALGKLNDTLKKEKYRDKKYKDLKLLKETGFKLDEYPKGSINNLPLITELFGYKKEEFRNAWFVDNIGSFLIVIERKNKLSK